MNTRQFNLRISHGLWADLELIQRATGINKGDWVRYKLAELIRNEKEISLRRAENYYIQGRIDEKEFTRITGYTPLIEVIKERESRFAKRAIVTDAIQKGTNRQAAKTALLALTKIASFDTKTNRKSHKE